MASEKVRLLAGLVLGFALLAPSSAYADASAADRETARSLMDDGDAKVQQQDFEGALESYKAADAIMHVPTTGIEVARMQRKLGKFVEATDTIAQILKDAPKPNEPAPFASARKDAEALADEISPLIPAITVSLVNVTPGQDVEVSFDGEVIPAAAARLPRKVNPGRHTIVAKAGNLERNRVVTVAERETKTVTFNFDQARDPEVFPETKEEPAPQVEKPDTTTSDILFYGGGGVAIVGVGVGAVTGLMSLSKVSDLNKNCPEVGGKRLCDPKYQGDRDSASSLGTVSTVSFVVGGLGIGAAIAGLLMAPPSPATPTKKHDSDDVARRARPFDPRVHAIVGPTWWGMGGTF